MTNGEEKNTPDYAGFWVRVASVCIDGFLISWLSLIPLALVTLIVNPIMSTGSYLKFIVFYMLGVSFGITILYFAWFNAYARQSPGKKVFGIVVLDNTSRGITFLQSLQRASFYLFDTLIFGLGHLLIVFNKEKKAFHDLAANTIVVRTSPKRESEPLLIIATIVIFHFAAELPQAFLRANYLQAFRIPASSLKPSILVGDFILVDKYDTQPKPPDLIVFKYPRDEKLDYIKRCIATGGQTVEVREDIAYVDGQPEGEIVNFGETYDPEEDRDVETLQITSGQNKTYFIRRYTDFNQYNYGPVTVPKDHYFVLGDNRDNSQDSRSWGFVPEENIVGKGGFIYFSWDKFQNKIRWSRIGEIVD